MRRNEGIREVWKSNFETVMNVSMGIRIHEERPHTQGRLERGEILKAIRKLKVGKAPWLGW